MFVEGLDLENLRAGVGEEIFLPWTPVMSRHPVHAFRLRWSCAGEFKQKGVFCTVVQMSPSLPPSPLAGAEAILYFKQYLRIRFCIFLTVEAVASVISESLLPWDQCIPFPLRETRRALCHPRCFLHPGLTCFELPFVAGTRGPLYRMLNKLV